MRARAEQHLLPARSINRRIPSFWTLQACGWLAFGIVMATSRIGVFSLAYMASAKAVLTILGLLSSLVLWRFYRRIFARVSVAQTIVICALASYVMACLWTMAFNAIDRHIQRAMLPHPDLFRPGPFVYLNGSVYHAFALFGWSVLYFAIKHYEALQVERERSLRAEALAQSAQLEALRYQLNPHFLFNTLNAISTLVVDHRNDDAQRMLSRLSDFLRTTLDNSATEVSLSEEIDVARRYLEIEKVRFGDRLAVTVDVAQDAWDASVPAFLLQPLVENAVHHAIARTQRGGSITISAARADGKLSVAVTDDGPGLSARGNGSGSGSGIGLANARARLEQLYGNRQSLTLAHGDGGGVVARIELPYRRMTSP